MSSMDDQGTGSRRDREAMELVEQGTELVTQQRFGEAKEFFARSLTLQPTAEGYTYLAWMLFYEGMVDEAIDLCKQAVEIDPDFGNPYNDIGSYLIQKGEVEEAIPWLERAKKAKRYEPRHFPYLNLGRLYLNQGNLERAADEYESVLEFDPENAEAKQVLKMLEEVEETAAEDPTVH